MQLLTRLQFDICYVIKTRNFRNFSWVRLQWSYVFLAIINRATTHHHHQHLPPSPTPTTTHHHPKYTHHHSSHPKMTHHHLPLPKVNPPPPTTTQNKRTTTQNIPTITTSTQIKAQKCAKTTRKIDWCYLREKKQLTEECP